MGYLPIAPPKLARSHPSRGLMNEIKIPPAVGTVMLFHVRPPSTVRKISAVVSTMPYSQTHATSEESTLIRRTLIFRPEELGSVTSCQRIPPSVVRNNLNMPEERSLATAQPVKALSMWIDSKPVVSPRDCENIGREANPTVKVAIAMARTTRILDHSPW